MENKKTLREIVGNNLTELRKGRGLTQLELANHFGYSDKAVSKWEHGDTLPDLETLNQLCEFYQISLDYLVHEGEERDRISYHQDDKKTEFNKGVIVSLIIASCWTLAFAVYFTLFALNYGNYWFIFPICLMLSLLVLLVFHNIWWKNNKIAKIAIQISFIWSIIFSLYLYLGWAMPNQNGWSLAGLLLTGIPLTVACILWNNLRIRR